VRHQNALPRWIKPQLTKLVDTPPEGSDWLHEIKFDGYRIHAWLDHGTIRLLTRTGLDWTHKYPAIAAAVSSLRAKQAYLDGELCGIRSDGHLFEDITRNTTRISEMEALDIPVKLIWGENDPYLNVGVAEDLWSHLSDASLHRISAGHWVQIDEPELVANAMLS
jgi:ATP-dependent DNA ligase